MMALHTPARRMRSEPEHVSTRKRIVQDQKAANNLKYSPSRRQATPASLAGHPQGLIPSNVSSGILILFRKHSQRMHAVWTAITWMSFIATIQFTRSDLVYDPPRVKIQQGAMFGDWETRFGVQVSTFGTNPHIADNFYTYDVAFAQIAAFRGVPFAAPPVGIDGRWMPPRAPVRLF